MIGRFEDTTGVHQYTCLNGPLKVTDVRIERVQDITDEQAKAEGCWHGIGGGEVDLAVSPQDHFPTLWESLYGNWNQNPYVWVIEFEVIHKNVDSVVSAMQNQGANE
jgi:hypothetical protein